MNVSRVYNDTLEYVWSQVEDMIERGLRHGAGDTTTMEILKASVIVGDTIMWAIHEDDEIVAVVLVSIKQRPRHKTVFVELIAGRDLDAWQEEVEELLIDFKDLIGAENIEGVSRPGMMKKLTRWKRKAFLMELR